MIRLLFVAPVVNAWWGLGFCRYPSMKENFDQNAFSGPWYEIYRDTDHDKWSIQKCTEDFYSNTMEGVMTLQRKYKTKWFGVELHQRARDIKKRLFSYY
jgi:hypothetical protein